MATRGGVAVQASFDGQDRLVSQGSTSYAYNAAGDLQCKSNTDGCAPEGIGERTTYSYDTLGALVEVDQSAEDKTITYTVDAQGRRIAKRVNGGDPVERYIYAEAAGPAASIDEAGELTRYVYATRSWVPDYLFRSGETYRIVTDHLGSPRLVIRTSDGAVVQEMDYDEFGRVTRDQTAVGFKPIPFGYAGGLYDRDTGLVRMGARDYDPDTGRWTSKDPIGFDGGDTNLYGYVLADPINLVDPAGTDFLDDASSFMSNASAGALDSLSFGYSTKLAGEIFGFNPACADFGAGFGTGQFLGNLNPKGLAKAAFKKGVPLAGAGAIHPRPKFRKGVPEKALDDAPGPTGAKTCPTCGAPIGRGKVKQGKSEVRDYDVDHDPEWQERVSKFPGDITRKEVIDEYQKDLRARCRPCNRGRR